VIAGALLLSNQYVPLALVALGAETGKNRGLGTQDYGCNERGRLAFGTMASSDVAG
jgi:hypothetical protein